jgi:hypothetical protein
MAVGGLRQAGPELAGPESLDLESPLQRRVRRQVGPHPARSLAVRATVIGAAALTVGFYLGPEDGFVPLLVLAAMGGFLGIRWASMVWGRRTVGRRIRRATGDVPASLGAWRVGGSGYWLRASGGDADASANPPLAPARPSGPPGAAPPVPWAPPARPDRVPWVPPTAVVVRPVSGASSPSAAWLDPIAGTSPAPAWAAPGDYGWRRATSGIGPFATGEEVEVLVTPHDIWVAGRLVERYPRSASTIEPIAEVGLAIIAGDGAVRRWITIVPDDLRDLGWVTELLVSTAPDDDAPTTDPPFEDPSPARAPAPSPRDASLPQREAWDGPHTVTDDGRR